MSEGLINKMTTKNKKQEPIQLSLFDEIDRQTKESTDKRKLDARQYLSAGNATFTVESTKLNKRFTYKVMHKKKDKCAHRYMVYKMYGNDNENNYRYIGLFYADTGVYKPANLGETTLYDKMFSSFVKMLYDNVNPWYNTCLFYKSTKCACCGRKLTTPESVELGIGPECYARIHNKGV
jgi:hypothetical protein